MSSWICVTCFVDILGAVPNAVDEKPIPESRRWDNCEQGRLCYLADIDMVRRARMDVVEIAGKMYEMNYQMERFHHRDHPHQPSDWRYCSAEPCSAVYTLYAELDHAMTVPEINLQL